MDGRGDHVLGHSERQSVGHIAHGNIRLELTGLRAAATVLATVISTAITRAETAAAMPQNSCVSETAEAAGSLMPKPYVSAANKSLRGRSAMGSLQIRQSRSRKAARQYWYSLGGWILALIGIGTCVVLALGWYPAKSAQPMPTGTVVEVLTLTNR
jgi:hypothetical protein